LHPVRRRLWSTKIKAANKGNAIGRTEVHVNIDGRSYCKSDHGCDSFVLILCQANGEQN